MKWRHKAVFECFGKIDKYFPRNNLKDACKHIVTWADFLRIDAKLSEKYRQESISLKIQLLVSGVSREAIESSDWSDRCLGINTIDAIVTKSIGSDVIDYIIKANLVSTDEKGLCVWSGNAESQIRHFLLEKLFYRKEWEGKEDENHL